MAITAGAAQVHPLPTTPPPPPAPRHTLAELACTRLFWAAVHALGCLLLASVWLFYWGLATMEIGRFACGWGSDVVTEAFKVVFVAGITLAVVFPLNLLLAWRIVRARAPAVVPVPAPAMDIEATKEPALKTSDAAKEVRAVLRDPLALGILAAVAFALLMGTGVLLAGASRPRMGAVTYYVGSFGMSTVDCFVLCPVITARVWSFRRNLPQVL